MIQWRRKKKIEEKKKKKNRAWPLERERQESMKKYFKKIKLNQFELTVIR